VTVPRAPPEADTRQRNETGRTGAVLLAARDGGQALAASAAGEGALAARLHVRRCGKTTSRRTALR